MNDMKQLLQPCFGREIGVRACVRACVCVRALLCVYVCVYVRECVCVHTPRKTGTCSPAGKPLWSQSFLALSKKYHWSLNWMLRPPLHFEDPLREHGLLVLNHEGNTQAVLIPDLCRALQPTHPALAAMHTLSAAFSSPEALKKARCGAVFCKAQGSRRGGPPLPGIPHYNLKCVAQCVV